MRVSEIMKRNVITVNPDTSLADALLLTKTHRIRHLPVIENDVLIGIVSDRDLREVCPSRLVNEDLDHLLQTTAIDTIMNRNVITAHPLDFVEDAASVFCEFKIGCLPVIQRGKLVGIITESDALRTLVDLMGVNQPSSHIEVEVDDEPGMLANVAMVLKEQRVNVTSIYIKPSEKENKKVIVLRVQTMDPRRICKEIEKTGYSVKDPMGLF